jgi:dipeptidyl aminopeptidase/acylaminoacyl peptidase
MIIHHRPHYRPFAWVAVAAVFLAPALAPAIDAQEGTKRLSLEMYLEWEDVSNPELSPDGSQIIYTRRWVDPMNDRTQSSLWIMDADGGRNRFLVDGSSPQWSPDGTRIAFLTSGDPGGTQIHVRWMDAEGAVSQVTRVEESPSSPQWSPDGRSIAFQMLVPASLDASWQVDLPRGPEGATWAEAPRIEDRLHFRRDGTGWLPRGSQHVFVVPANGGSPRQITEGDWDHTGPTWMPDGGSILVRSLRVEKAEYRWRESHIYAVNVATRQIRQLTTERGPWSDPVPSPDGQLIAFQGLPWHDDTYRENELYVMASDGSDRRSLASEMGGSMGNVTWAPDGTGLYFNASMLGARNLWFAPLSGEPRQVTEGDHILSMSTFSREGRAVGTRSGPHEPGSLVAFDVRDPAAVQTLHAANASLLEDVRLGEVEEIWYPSVDGLRIQGWIVKPPDFDPTRRYPLILRIHGGPHSMFNVGFDFKNQDHAAHDYVVLYTNPRGSSGYGSAFGNEIKNAYPSLDYDDLMIGVDSLIARGYIDDRNLFVYGGSGGGVLTAWIVGHTDRFAAAVVKSPVINWLSFVGTTDGTGWYRNFASLPWEDPSEHLQRSPLMYVGNVTTPTMLMTGELDRRTPMPQTEEYYQALRYLEVPTAMVRMQNSWHSRGSPPSTFMRVQLYLRNWFERHSVGDARATDNGGDRQ